VKISSSTFLEAQIAYPCNDLYPIFIVKTQLTERSGITEKHRENHIKNITNIENEKKKL